MRGMTWDTAAITAVREYGSLYLVTKLNALSPCIKEDVRDLSSQKFSAHDPRKGARVLCPRIPGLTLAACGRLHASHGEVRLCVMQQ